MMQNTEMVSILQLTVARLSLLDTDELQSYVDAAYEALARQQAIGMMFDVSPRFCRTTFVDGSLEDMQLQLRITRHLLAARKAIDVREAHLAKYNRGGE